MNKKALRYALRHQRRSLTSKQRKAYSRALLQHMVLCPEFLSAQRVALYLSNDGEMDLAPVIQNLWQRKKEVYLPVLHPFYPGKLAFIRYEPSTRMSKNRFGIAEPDFRYGKKVSARFLDLVCLPLVGFDKRGNRLGMGGGFYDRSFAFKKDQHRRPKLVGCAYAFQRVDLLPVESWDIPLNMIATEQFIHRL